MTPEQLAERIGFKANELHSIGGDRVLGALLDKAAATLRRLAAENAALREQNTEVDQACSIIEKTCDGLADENAELKSHLKFVERWANHHATKPHMTAEQALSVIQHYPPIKAITEGYADGRMPDTHDPYAENAALRKDAERYRFIRDVPYTDYIYNVMTHQKNGVMDAAIDAAMQKETQ